MHVGDYVNYPVYYDNVATCCNNYTEEDIPADEYKGWRVLSIEGTGDSQYIRLISAGLPLNYYHSENSATSVKNLTINFFNTPINSNLTKNSFYKCGFKNAPNGTLVTTIASVKELFDNPYTAKYSIGESATYTDSTLNQTFTNSNVAKQPKVQSMTKEDLDAVFGESVSSETRLVYYDLLAIPCKDITSDYATTCLASAYNANHLWNVYISGEAYYDDYENAGGVRCVVSLTPSVKYSLSNDNQSTDAVKTWNIE